MPELETQLRAYGQQLDELFPDVRVDELIESITPSTTRARSRRGLLVALAAAALVLLVAGALTLLLFSVDQQIVDEPLPTPSTVPGEPGAFEGMWTSVSLGWPPMLLTSMRETDGTFSLLMEDSGRNTELAHLCTGWFDEVPATARVLAEESDANTLSVTEVTVVCGDGSIPSDDVSYLVHERGSRFVYDPGSDTMISPDGRAWRRVVALEPKSAAGEEWKGVWPQSTRAEAEEAQRLADAGDPEYAWQVIDMAPESIDYEDVGMRFVREVVGWENYEGFDGGYMTFDETASMMGPGYGRYVRCDPNGSNPHYPEFGCAPGNGDTFEMITVSFDNLVRREAGGIAIVTGWVESTMDQTVPPAPEQVLQLVGEFLEARVSGEGADKYLAGPVPQGADLYRTSEDSPFVDFEIVAGPYPGDDSPVQLTPQWPIGSYVVYARLTAADGTVLHEFYEMEPFEFAARTLHWMSSTPPSFP